MSGGSPSRGTLYDVLGVAPGADDAELRRAYVTLARRFHPDVAGGDDQRMRAINEAWGTLGDPLRRARYDSSLRAREPSSAHVVRDTGTVADDGIDLSDDVLRATVRLPGWLSLLPVGLFAASAVAFVVGVVLGATQVLAFALMSFALSCLLFLASPFIALFASRRASGHEGG